MIIGLLVLIIAFILSCAALCCSLNIALLPFVGVLLIVVGETASRTKTCNNNNKTPKRDTNWQQRRIKEQLKRDDVIPDQ